MVRGWKRYKIEEPKSWQMKIPPKRVDYQGNMNKSSTQTCLPPFSGEKKSISDNERGEEHHSSTSIGRLKIQNGSDLGRFVQNL